MHVDDFIDDFDNPENYAKFVLFYMRLPAARQFVFREYMKEFPLYCIWKGTKYRVTGASRFGDVWLAKNFKRECGYDHRVMVDECSQWGKK